MSFIFNDQATVRTIPPRRIARGIGFRQAAVYSRVVPIFVPLTPPMSLPPIDTAIERAMTDWKSEDRGTTFHRAKDVAAFANHLGGTLVIGAIEANGHLHSYKGISADAAAVVRRAYSQAIEQRCQPRPIVDFEEYLDPGDSAKKIVVVNVWPSLQLIGVKIEAHKPTEGYGGPSFVYPIRSGVDAAYLEPSQIAMYMTPHVRRVAVLLSRVPRGTAVVVMMPTTHDYHDETAYLEAVHEEENIVTFVTVDDNRPLRIPLDRITTAFEDWDSIAKTNVWRVLVEFWNFPSPPRPQSPVIVPRIRVPRGE